MSWAAVAIGVTATGAAISGTGTILGGISKSKGDKAAGDAALAGAEIKATSYEQAGTFAQSESDFLAQEYDQSASEARASSQRDAYEKRRTAKLALSTLVARAASGGGRATDPTVLKLASDIGERGEYLALSEMYTGENKARGFEDKAAAERYSGAAKKYGYDADALYTRYLGKTEKYAGDTKASGDLVSGFLGGSGTILSGLGSSLSAYGKASSPTYGKPLSLSAADYG